METSLNRGEDTSVDNLTLEGTRSDSPDLGAEYMEKLGKTESSEEILRSVAGRIFGAGEMASALSRYAASLGAQPKLISSVVKPESDTLNAVCGSCGFQASVKKSRGLSEEGVGPLEIGKLLSHVLTRHMSESGLFRCSECPYSVGTKQMLKTHAKKEHEGRPMQSVPDVPQRQAIFQAYLSLFSSIKLDLIFSRLDQFDNVDPKIQKLFA